MITISLIYEFSNKGISKFRNSLIFRGKPMTEDYFKLHEAVCKSISHATRLRILYLLDDKTVSAKELGEELGISPSNLAQHLAILKNRNVLIAFRKGNQMFYKISNPKVMKAIRLMSEVIKETQEEQSSIIEKQAKAAQ